MSVLSNILSDIADCDVQISDCKARIASGNNVSKPDLYKSASDYIAYYKQHINRFGWFAAYFNRLCMQIDSERLASYRAADSDLTRCNNQLVFLQRKRADLVRQYNSIVADARAAANADFLPSDDVMSDDSDLLSGMPAQPSDLHTM